MSTLPSPLDELFDYKNQLMEALCSNESVVKLVTDEDEPNVPNLDLPYTRIFPYEFVPETVDDAGTFICLDVDIDDVANKTYLYPVIYIWVFTHKSKMHLPTGGIRTDQLCVEIDRMLNGNRRFGLGTLELKNVGRFAPILDYQGRALVYAASDFNRPGVSRLPPANRKR